jgi:hypothetical protein
VTTAEDIVSAVKRKTPRSIVRGWRLVCPTCRLPSAPTYPPTCCGNILTVASLVHGKRDDDVGKLQ